jgi:hypothetical protein
MKRFLDESDDLNSDHDPDDPDSVSEKDPDDPDPTFETSDDECTKK